MRFGFLWVMTMGTFGFLGTTYGQEDQKIVVEKSAEVFLEEYSDEFQENFFEGLKQKGIQNYDRAINFLLECKRLKPENRAVTHELAKLYFLDKNYVESRAYGIEAVSQVPNNYWYLNTLMTTLKKQGNDIDVLANEIPIGDPKLQENLAKIYYRRGKYEAALKLLNPLQKSKSITVLEQKATDALDKKKNSRKSVSFIATVVNTDMNDLESYKSRIDDLLIIPADNPILLQVSEEALESYPAQPYFYYAHGYALNKNGSHREAIEILETALDYMLSDNSLANRIYTELSIAYNAISNPSKANMYLRKVKPGF